MAPSTLFLDRTEAGQQLAQRLAPWITPHDPEPPLVLGLPRGGVVVAAEVARRLGLPLDIWVVRKLGAPRQPELGMGAVAEGGELFLHPAIVAAVGATLAQIDEEARYRLAQVQELVARFRHGRPSPELRDRTVILIDDGIATGGTMRVAARALRKRGVKRVIVATPVAAKDALEQLRPEVDDLVCLVADSHLQAVSAWYVDFAQVTESAVVALLDRAGADTATPPATRPEPPTGSRRSPGRR